MVDGADEQAAAENAPADETGTENVEADAEADAEAETEDDEVEVEIVAVIDGDAADEDASGEAKPAPVPGSEDLNLGQERVLEFLSFVMVNLVEHPEDVKIDLVRRDDRDVYKVRVHEEDLGKVIGKGGQTARALRVMLTALSSRTDQRIGLDIVE